jgi:TRAP-type C4-dicarboxylate transport system permease small subunit
VKALINGLFRALEGVMVVLLAVMTLMVLGNVVLRYLFDSGIQLSEELSRFLFVWLTFIGAVVIARQNMHLGVETLVAVLGRQGRVVCMVLSDLLVILCCAVFFWGTWQQAEINATFYAPVSGISMLWVYGVGFFTSIGMAVIALARIVRASTGQLTPAEIEQFAGSNEGADMSIKERLE